MKRVRVCRENRLFFFLVQERYKKVVVDSHHAKKLLGHGGGDQAGTAGGRDQTHADGSALTGHLTHKKKQQKQQRSWRVGQKMSTA